MLPWMHRAHTPWHEIQTSSFTVYPRLVGLNNSRQHRPAGASHFKRAIIGRAAPQRTGRRPERKRKGPETELNPQSPPTTTKAGRASERACQRPRPVAGRHCQHRTGTRNRRGGLTGAAGGGSGRRAPGLGRLMVMAMDPAERDVRLACELRWSLRCRREGHRGRGGLLTVRSISRPPNSRRWLPRFNHEKGTSA